MGHLAYQWHVSRVYAAGSCIPQCRAMTAMAQAKHHQNLTQMRWVLKVLLYMLFAQQSICLILELKQSVSAGTLGCLHGLRITHGSQWQCSIYHTCLQPCSHA